MGLMGLLLKLAVECFNVFAWPLFALAYPLCASVQAIETNSKSNTLKLITYWVCLSLILLHEYAFAKLLEWLPSWPYIKLIMVGCLVIPRFNGSFYVYKHLVHPCLSTNPHNVIVWFIKLKEFLKQDNLLVEVNREAKETGPDAVENHFASGPSTVFKPNPEEAKVAQKESNDVPIVEMKELTSTKQVRQRKPSGICVPADVKEIKDATVARRDFLDMLPSEEIQMHSSGDACQVKPANETYLVSHLQGTPTEDDCEELKANNQTSNTNTPISVEMSASQESKEMSAASLLSRDNHDKLDSKDVQEMWICSICQETGTGMAGFVSHLQQKQHADACKKLKAEEQALKSKVCSASAEDAPSPKSSCNLPENLQSNSSQAQWTCAVCHLELKSKADLVSHFQGKPHNGAIEKLKIKIETSRSSNLPATPETEMAGSVSPQNLPCKGIQFPWICCICEVTIYSEANLVSHFQGTRHVKACEKAKTLIQTLKRDVSPTSTGKKSNSCEEMGNISSPQNAGSEVRKQQNIKSVVVEPNPEEAKVSQKESNDMAMVENKEVSATKQIRQTESDLALSKTCASVDVTEVTSAMIGGRNFLDMPSSKEILRDGACDACQVAPASEMGHVSHLQGRPIEDACEELKASNQTSNPNNPTSVGTSASLESKGTSSASVASRDNHVKQHSEDVQKKWICSVCQEIGTGVAGFVLHFQGKQHVDACEKLKAKEQALKSKVSSASIGDAPSLESSCSLPENLKSNSSQALWSCAVCHLNLKSKVDLVSHFQGRPHTRAIEKLKNKIEASKSTNLPATPEKEMADKDRPQILQNKSFQFPWICRICEVTIQSEATLVSHLQGTRHVNACEKAKTLIQTLKRDVSPASTGKKSNSSEEMEKYESDVSSTSNTRSEVKLEENMMSGVVEPNPEEAKVAQKESNDVAMMEKKEVMSTQQVRQNKPDLAQSGPWASADVKEITDSTVAGRGFNMLPSEEALTDCACYACQVTPASETRLVLHLQGRPIEDAWEELKGNYQTSSGNTPTSVGTSASLGSMASRDNHDKQHSKDVQKMWICSICGETGTGVAGFLSHLQGKQHVDASEKLTAKERALKSKVSSASAAVDASLDTGCSLPENLQSSSSQTPWTCAVCQVKVTSKLDLISHFQGKPHKGALEKLKVKIGASKSNDLPATPEKEMVGSDRPENLHYKSVQFPWICRICKATIQSESSLVSHLDGARHVNACENARRLIQTLKRDVSPKEMEKYESGNVSSPQNTGSKAKKQENMKIGVVEVRNTCWQCTICKVKCGSEGNMYDHLKGSRHLAKTRELQVAGGSGLP